MTRMNGLKKMKMTCLQAQSLSQLHCHHGSIIAETDRM